MGLPLVHFSKIYIPLVSFSNMVIIVVNKLGTKTIVLDQKTYDKLKERKRFEREPFGDVIEVMFNEIESLKQKKNKK